MKITPKQVKDVFTNNGFSVLNNMRNCVDLYDPADDKVVDLINDKNIKYNSIEAASLKFTSLDDLDAKVKNLIGYNRCSIYYITGKNTLYIGSENKFTEVFEQTLENLIKDVKDEINYTVRFAYFKN
jgi:hypothetical protein